MAGALPRTPLGELTALPQTSWLQWVEGRISGRDGREGEDRKGEERGGREEQGWEGRGGEGKGVGKECPHFLGQVYAPADRLMTFLDLHGANVRRFIASEVQFSSLHS